MRRILDQIAKETSASKRSEEFSVIGGEDELRAELRLEYLKQLDGWATEAVEQFARGNVYLQEGAFITEDELNELRKEIFN